LFSDWFLFAPPVILLEILKERPVFEKQNSVLQALFAHAYKMQFC
jgi:hypothetical protein